MVYYEKVRKNAQKSSAPIINNFDPPTHFSDHMVLLYGQLNYQFFAKFDLEHQGIIICIKHMEWSWLAIER